MIPFDEPGEMVDLADQRKINKSPRFCQVGKQMMYEIRKLLLTY